MKKKIGLLLIAALLISVPNCTNADGTTKIEINGKQVAYTKEAGTPTNRMRFGDFGESLPAPGWLSDK